MKIIFEPLYTAKGREIGLGLAVTANVVKNDGGSMEVESKEGEGTKFMIILPTKNGIIGDNLHIVH